MPDVVHRAFELLAARGTVVLRVLPREGTYLAEEGGRFAEQRQSLRGLNRLFARFRGHARHPF